MEPARELPKKAMKRITYMSRFAANLSAADVEQIGSHAAAKNKKAGVTGVLFSLGSMFFQIIEGNGEQIDDLFELMRQDPRHLGVVCLKSESNVIQRLFPDWSMKAINLDAETGQVMAPIKLMLERIGESRQIIDSYTQPSVSQMMESGINPLEVPLQKVERVMLFSDIFSFGSICNTSPLDDVSELINTFLEICSRQVMSHGGEVAKYIGDSVMATFKPEQAGSAIDACMGALEDLESLRDSAPKESLLRVLYGGFGIAQGAVIEGNIGSTVKLDFTVIGDAVNTAARLEAMTRALNRPLLLTDQVMCGLETSWEFEDLGKMNLKGKEDVDHIFTVASKLCLEFDPTSQIEDHLSGSTG
jgi:class 3 adenylate cyclase